MITAKGKEGKKGKKVRSFCLFCPLCLFCFSCFIASIAHLRKVFRHQPFAMKKARLGVVAQDPISRHDG